MIATIALLAFMNGLLFGLIFGFLGGCMFESNWTREEALAREAEARGMYYGGTR